MENVEFDWKGYRWSCVQEWGETHALKRNSWYDMWSVYRCGDSICLTITDHEKEFDGVVKNYGIGLMRCVDEFKYGRFSWKCHIPRGKNLWPALWMASYSEWPPEIDCMEGWSKDKNYRKMLFFKNIKPSVHWCVPYGYEECEHNMKTTNPVPFWYVKSGENEFVTEWTSEYIRFCYNGRTVMEITDKSVLDHMNMNDIRMHPIMNLEVDHSFSENDYSDFKSNGRDFMIVDFKYDRKF